MFIVGPIEWLVVCEHLVQFLLNRCPILYCNHWVATTVNTRVGVGHSNAQEPVPIVLNNKN